MFSFFYRPVTAEDLETRTSEFLTGLLCVSSISPIETELTVVRLATLTLAIWVTRVHTSTENLAWRGALPPKKDSTPASRRVPGQWLKEDYHEARSHLRFHSSCSPFDVDPDPGARPSPCHLEDTTV